MKVKNNIPDFQKKKTRIGKIIPRSNVTKITVKTKKLHIPSQNALGSKDISSYKELLDKITKKLNHYNTSAKIAAFEECKNFIISSPNPDNHLAIIIPTALEVLYDEDRDSRNALIGFIAAAMKKCSLTAFTSVSPILITFLCSGLTSINKGIRRDALLLTEVVATQHPALLLSSLEKILGYILILLSDSSLNTGPQSFLSLATVTSSTSSRNSHSTKVTTKQSTTLSVILHIIAKILSHCSSKPSASYDQASYPVLHFDAMSNAYDAIIIILSESNRQPFSLNTSSSSPGSILSSSCIDEMIIKLAVIWRDLVLDESVIAVKTMETLHDALISYDNIYFILSATSSSCTSNHHFIAALDLIMKNFPYQSHDALVAAHASSDAHRAKKIVDAFNISICNLILSSRDHHHDDETSEQESISLAASYIIQCLEHMVSSTSIIIQPQDSNDTSSFAEMMFNDDIISKINNCIRILLISLFHTSCMDDAQSSLLSRLLQHIQQLIDNIITATSSSSSSLSHLMRSLISTVTRAVKSSDSFPIHATPMILQILHSISSCFVPPPPSSSCRMKLHDSYLEMFHDSIIHMLQRINLQDASNITTIIMHIRNLCNNIFTSYTHEPSLASGYRISGVVFYAAEVIEDLSSTLAMILPAIIIHHDIALHQYFLQVLYERRHLFTINQFVSFLLSDMDAIIRHAISCTSSTIIPSSFIKPAQAGYSIYDDMDVICSMMSRYVENESYAITTGVIIAYMEHYIAALKAVKDEVSTTMMSMSSYMQVIACIKLAHVIVAMSEDVDMLMTMICRYAIWLTCKLKAIASISHSLSHEQQPLPEQLAAADMKMKEVRSIAMNKQSLSSIDTIAKQLTQPLVSLLQSQAHSNSSMKAICAHYIRYLHSMDQHTMSMMNDKDVELMEEVMWGFDIMVSNPQLAMMQSVPAVVATIQIITLRALDVSRQANHT